MVAVTSERTLSVGLAVLLCIVLIGAAEAPNEPIVANPAEQSASGSDDSRPAESSSAAEDEAEQAKREAAKQKIVAGMMIVGGLLGGGIALLVLIVLWGQRTRRILRGPLPEQHTGDELWYLRPPKSPLPGQDAEDPADQGAEESPSGGDEPADRD